MTVPRQTRAKRLHGYALSLIERARALGGAAAPVARCSPSAQILESWTGPQGELGLRVSGPLALITVNVDRAVVVRTSVLSARVRGERHLPGDLSGRRFAASSAPVTLELTLSTDSAVVVFEPAVEEIPTFYTVPRSASALRGRCLYGAPGGAEPETLEASQTLLLYSPTGAPLYDSGLVVTPLDEDGLEIEVAAQWIRFPALPTPETLPR